MSELFLVCVDSESGDDNHHCYQEEDRKGCKYRLTVMDIEGKFIKQIIVPAYNNSMCSTPIIFPSHYPLICFHNSRGQLYFCNPSTEWVLPLPPFSPCAYNGKYSCFHMGFAYSASTSEYKLVHLFYTKYCECGRFELCCEVYSLPDPDAADVNFTNSCGSWKRVGAKCPLPIEGIPVCVCGALHWFFQEDCEFYVETSESSSRAAIVSFDLKTEQFKTMPATAQWDEITRYGATATCDMFLRELRGNLVVFDTISNVLKDGNTSVSAWRVLNYKLGEWEKLYSIDLCYLDNMANFLIGPELDEDQVGGLGQRREINVYPIKHVGDGSELILHCMFDGGRDNRFTRIVHYDISTMSFKTLEVDMEFVSMGTFKSSFIWGASIND